MPDHVMNYVESDAPAGLTLVEWRRTQVALKPRRRHGWLRTFGRPVARSCSPCLSPSNGRLCSKSPATSPGAIGRA